MKTNESSAANIPMDNKHQKVPPKKKAAPDKQITRHGQKTHRLTTIVDIKIHETSFKKRTFIQLNSSKIN